MQKQIEAVITNEEQLNMFRSSIIKKRSHNHQPNCSEQAVLLLLNIVYTVVFIKKT